MNNFSKLRIGNGVDFHKFANEEGKFLLPIGGIKIPFYKKILAHSDGDVLLHSLCDAIFGSLANGNIGTHFPPSDDKWKNANSIIFLEYAINELKKKGGTIINIDSTIICEEPKIMPHVPKMKEIISKICNLEIAQISIKAVTTEKMGFLGNKEGVACLTNILTMLA